MTVRMISHHFASSQPWSVEVGLPMEVEGSREEVLLRFIGVVLFKSDQNC